jgi:hypothetical protein
MRVREVGAFEMRVLEAAAKAGHDSTNVNKQRRPRRSGRVALS